MGEAGGGGRIPEHCDSGARVTRVPRRSQHAACLLLPLATALESG